jgi:hypothetical protein
MEWSDTKLLDDAIKIVLHFFKVTRGECVVYPTIPSSITSEVCVAAHRYCDPCIDAQISLPTEMCAAEVTFKRWALLVGASTPLSASLTGFR